jgi:tetratricopeptide (TPR) repeat protein
MIIALRTQGKWSDIEDLLTAYESLQQEMSSEQGLANALMLRMDVAVAAGNYENAERVGRKLLDELAERLTSTQEISLVAALWDCHTATGRAEDAAKLAARLQDMVDEHTGAGVDPTPEMLLLCAKARAQMAAKGTGDMGKALELLARGIEVARRRHLTESTGELYGLRASIYRMQGKLQDAIASYGQALKEIADEGNEYNRAILLCNLATALREAGHLQDSELRYREAQAVARRIDVRGVEALVFLKAATVAHDLGRWEEVEALAREAGRLASEAGDRATEAKAALIVAGRLMDTGDPAGAEREARTVLERETLPASTRGEALALCALASRAQGKLDQALRLIDEALEFRQISTTDQAAGFFYAGLIYFDAGRSDEALERLAMALNLIGQDAMSPLTLNIRQLRGDIHRSRDDLRSAQGEYETAVHELRRLQKHVIGERDRFQGLSKFATIAEKLTHVLLCQGNFTEALDALEKAKARGFVERLGLTALPVPRAVPSELREREHQLLDEISNLERRVAIGASAAQRRRVMRDYMDTIATYEQLLERIGEHAPEYVEWRQGATMTFDDLRKMLSNTQKLPRPCGNRFD